MESKYFDSIRVSSNRKKSARNRPDAEEIARTTCQWKGCEKPAQHRAPKGRGREGEFFSFCQAHAREYNANYNYFSGMSDAEIEDFQEDAKTGHRPTWEVAENPTSRNKRRGRPIKRRGPAAAADGVETKDPHSIFETRAKRARNRPAQARKLRPLEKKAFKTMHLPDDASKEDIKTKFKDLVKAHHPDANGGDKGAEDKLREIIQAYNFLKTAGLV